MPFEARNPKFMNEPRVASLKVTDEMDLITRYGTDYQEWEEPPIFNHEGNPVAALVVAAPTQRITSSRDSSLVSDLKTAAAKILAQLYYDRE